MQDPFLQLTSPFLEHLAHTCSVFLMFGPGVGWYTHAVTGQSLPYLISDGYPPHSREYKSSASASQPSPGSQRSGASDGDRTSGSAPASAATISGTKRSAPETSGSAGAIAGLPSGLDRYWGASDPDGRDNLSFLSSVASGDHGRGAGPARPPTSVSSPTSSDGGLEDERTKAGSPFAGSAPVPVESCDSDGVLRSQHINSCSLIPFTDLSQLSPSELARHFANAATVDDPPPSVSPRLGVVLQHFGVTAKDCAGTFPDTLAKASCCLDTSCFGRKTEKVIHACITKWDVIASAEAAARGTSRKAIYEEQCSRMDSCLTAPPEPSASDASVLTKMQSDASWDQIVPSQISRGKALPRSVLLGSLYKSSDLCTSKQIEDNERFIAGAQLLAFVPAFMHAAIISLEQHELEQLPIARKQQLFRAKFAAFSPGSVSGARRALSRLVEWLVLNEQDGCFSQEPPWLTVSGGLLALFAKDEAAKSKGGSQGGASVAPSLRAGLTWAFAHLGCTGLGVKADVFLSVAAPSTAIARQAVSVTIRVLQQFRTLRSSHLSPLVRYYAAGFELLCVASLRMRDAQRATISFTRDVIPLSGGTDIAGYLEGICYSSKHPKRRSLKKKYFFAPVRAGSIGLRDPDGYVGILTAKRHAWGGNDWDYIFPRVSCPRDGSVASESAKRLPGPAASHDAIRHLRALLMLPPLSLSKEQAAFFSGHSGRHLMVTLGKSLSSLYGHESQHGRYSHDQLALLGDWLEGSMVHRYSSEQYKHSKLELLVHLLSDIDTVTERALQQSKPLPVFGGWGELAAMVAPDGKIDRARKPTPDGYIEPEQSDSDSSDDSEDED